MQVNEPKVTNKEMVDITFRLPSYLVEDLEAFATKHGITPADVFIRGFNMEKWIDRVIKEGGKIVRVDRKGNMFEMSFQR
jgi:hypothetical protein